MDKSNSIFLSDFIGKSSLKERLLIYIEAAKKRGEALDHVLLYGPPGLGKTTLARIIANEMGVNMRVTSGPVIGQQGDLAALITNLQEGDVLFIDKIHRLKASVEEVLCPAMEDYALDIIIGKGPSARVLRVDLPKFTLIGATTDQRKITDNLFDKFGIVEELKPYNSQEMSEIVKAIAAKSNVIVEDKVADLIAQYIDRYDEGEKVFRRIKDYIEIKKQGEFTLAVVEEALYFLEYNNSDKKR